MGNQLLASQPACVNEQQCYPKAGLANQEVLPASLKPSPESLCFPSPSPSCSKILRSPFPSLHQVFLHPPCPKLDHEQHQHQGSALSPAGTPHPFFYPVPKPGDFSFSRSPAKHMSVCFSTQLICSRRIPEKIFVQHKVRCELMLKDFSCGIARDRHNRRKPNFVCLLVSVLLHIRPNLTCPKTLARAAACLEQAEQAPAYTACRGKDQQERSTLQGTRNLKEGLKAPAKAVQSSSHQPSPAQSGQCQQGRLTPHSPKKPKQYQTLCFKSHHSKQARKISHA